MPKFKSKLLQTEVKNADGSIKVIGQVAWLPENDAAKASERSKEAMELGAYSPKDPNEMENMRKALKERERADLGRRGMIASR